MKSSAVFQLENAGWPALLLDSTTTICRSNAAAIRQFGPTLEGETPLLAAIWAAENSSAPEPFFAQWERTPNPTVQLKLRAKGGNTVISSAAICSFTKDDQKYFLLQLIPEGIAPPSHSAGASLDTTVIHSQKLECALQLTRTVALDFNNALTGILGHTSLVLSQIEPNHPWRGSLLEIEKSASKAAEVANDLAMFSRAEKQPRGQAAGNLNLLVQRTIEVFQNQSPEKPIEWSVILEKRLFTSRFDEAKLQQALIRVVENALEAIRDRGRIAIQTRNVELAEQSRDQTVKLAAGAYVTLEVSDDGEGIKTEILPRIFEPFFTTKGSPHRGLGLAWVYGVVTNQGGGVAVSSRPGAGTSVRIYLPAEKSVLKDNGATEDDLRGTQTILMVDDEDLLLTMGQAVLTTYGYRVLIANSGQQALTTLSTNPSIDLMITDLIMPTMSGRELVEQARQLAPATRILCTSGYIWPAGHHDQNAYLQKPFTSRDLLLKVKQVLAD